MPNHWESSARPLFVKTVFINGNRHAILFEKDPLLRCINSPPKKTSRPGSSLSFTSDLSISISEDSQDTNSECKAFKLKSIDRNQGKDLSSELQSCLVKFNLASNSLKNKYVEEKCLQKKAECKGKENSKHKTHKANRDKIGKGCESFIEEEIEYNPTDRENSGNKSCYIYNLENFKRRKNYSFVKITSQPSQFILNCSCKCDWNEIHNCNSQYKNNLVISASIQNLVMSPNENENMSEQTFDYVLPFENSELNWNNYLMKYYYNSLAERVFQWLDLTRKRKNPSEKQSLTDVSDSRANVERICSGKKFAEEIKKHEDLSKSTHKTSINKKAGKLIQSDLSEEEIEEKVVREQNIETLLSLEEIQKNSLESSDKTNSLEKNADEITGKETQPSDSILSKLNLLTNSPPFSLPKEPHSSTSNIIQKFFEKALSKENNSFRNHQKEKIDVPCNASSRQNKDKETRRNEERNFSVTEKGNKTLTERTENRIKHSKVYCDRNLDKYADGVNSQILTEEFAERNQKSINNLNITRTRPVLIQNLSPQQHDKISSLEKEEKIVWTSEKSTGRLQLHIFMPSLLLRDQSDDNLSECETFLNF